MSKVKVCQVSSVHFALDTRIFYRTAVSLATFYSSYVIGVHHIKQTLNGVHIIPIKRFKNKLLRICITWFIILIKCLKVNAKVYQIHDPELLPTALILRLLGKKVVYDIHENIADDIWDKPWIKQKKLLYFVFNSFEKIAAKFMPFVITENSYKKRYASITTNLTLVQNFPKLVDFEPFAVLNRQLTKPISLFYSGILLNSRCIFETIEAIYLLKKQGIIVNFNCVGELYSTMDVQIDGLPYINEIKKQLFFHGRLPLPQSYAISSKSHIGLSLIYPMHNSIGSYPTKMFEYLAVGLPQICSNFELYESVVVKNNVGLSCNPLQSDNLVNAIKTYINNPNLYNNHAINAKKQSLLYQWDNEFKKLKNIYNSLLNP